jgi:hypothetical protein
MPVAAVGSGSQLPDASLVGEQVRQADRSIFVTSVRDPAIEDFGVLELPQASGAVSDSDGGVGLVVNEQLPYWFGQLSSATRPPCVLLEIIGNDVAGVPPSAGGGSEGGGGTM